MILLIIKLSHLTLLWHEIHTKNVLENKLSECVKLYTKHTYHLHSYNKAFFFYAVTMWQPEGPCVDSDCIIGQFPFSYN